jgi:RNA polymerase sigma-70 factor (ECF subfamily)
MLKIEEIVIKQARDGNQNAFREIYREMSPALFAYCRKSMNTHEQAEDVLQETFMRLIKNLHKIKSSEHLVRWLYMTSGNLIKNQYRENEKNNKIRSEVLVDDQKDCENNSDGIFNKLEKMEFQNKEVLLLRFQQGLSISQISEIVNKPLGTIKSRLHYSLEKLARLVKKENFHER